MVDDTVPSFDFPAVGRKKVTAAFDGGRLTSDSGVMLLSLAERRLGIAERLARLIPDQRDPTPHHPQLRRHDPGPHLRHLLRLPRTPTISTPCAPIPPSSSPADACPTPGSTCARSRPCRGWRMRLALRDVIRLTYALVDAWMDSYPREPEAVTLDIDDTCDVVHGHQQLSLFNAHYDERCFLPIHVYDTERSRPVAVVLRPGKTPSGVEVRAHVRRLVRRIRARWPKTRILLRGDGHYARPEAMAWCEANGLQYVFGLPGSKPLSRKVEDTADAVPTARAVGDKPVVRDYAETRHKAGSWNRERRAVARIEATRLGLDIRFVVTNIERGSPEWVYDSLYCARGQAENLIKLHKSQLRSDRTSCRSALANQVRLVLHTAAYWLMLDVRDAIPKVRDLASAEFTTLRLRLLKIAARIVETRHRVRIAFAQIGHGSDRRGRAPHIQISPSLQRSTDIAASTDGAPRRRNPHARGAKRRCPDPIYSPR